MAGVALMALGWLCWRVWARLVAGDAAALCVFCVAGVALENIHLRFLQHVALMALGWLWWRAWARLVAGDAAQLCVAGVALGDICLRFAWQAWHLWRQPPCFRVAGVALMALGGALGPVLVAGDVVALCVAGMALGNMYLRFTWQAWHLVTSSFVLRGRHRAYGTAGVALTVARTISHTHPCHTPSVTDHLSHTTLSQFIFHLQLCHTSSFTQTLSPTTLSHTSFTHYLSQYNKLL